MTANTSRSTIVCVDDEKMLLNILAEQLTEWLGENYTIEKALGGEDALAIIDECIENNIDVSVVISDYIMPNMKGDELFEKVNQRDSRIRKIMLTGYSSLEGIVQTINRAGLYRYLTKPWDNRDLMLTVIEAIKSFEMEKKTYNLSKCFEVSYRKYESLYFDLQDSYENTIKSLVEAIDARGPLIAGHSQRVAKYSLAIGEAYNMPKQDLKTLEYSATLHDIGTIGLNDTELKEMSEIQLYGATNCVHQQNEIAESIVVHMNNSEKILESIKYQWERFDGLGTYGLKDTQIPIKAHIIGISNYYDILHSKILMANERPAEYASKILAKTKDTIFDPYLVDTFMEIILSN